MKEIGSNVRRIFLDYAATTPVDEKVFQAMRPYFGAKFGNPGSLHSFGQEAIGAVDLSREIIAKAIGAEFREVVFTGSATEANNLVLRGLVSGIKYHVSGDWKPRLIISAVEHESVLETVRALEKKGVEVIIIPVNKNGIVDLKKLKEILNERTVFVSIMYANNEIGTIQPIVEISRIIGDFREELGIRNKESVGNSKFQIHNSLFPFFHTDAVQALQFLDCNVNNLGVDLMTISAHKIYGPKGVGALYIKNNNLGNPFISAIVSGGGQEFGLRSGTENVPNIVGFGKVVELVEKNREKEVRRILELKKRLWSGIKKIYSKAEINGVPTRMTRKNANDTKIKNFGQLPNILNVYFPDYKAEEVMIGFDLAGVAVSSGSACSSRAAKVSHVITALGYSEERARRSIRFSLGWPTTKKEIDTTIKIFKNLISRLKK
ncbi:MAG: cysteine desulfurase family protein [Candidatus Paceibacterota bacterium]|jgi:cysteine desulfurase